MPWSVHFVFALPLTAWAFIAIFVFYLATRVLGIPTFFAATGWPMRNEGLALFALLQTWQLIYVFIALRRVYADGLIAAGAKTALMIVAGLIVGNALLFLSVWLATKLA